MGGKYDPLGLGQGDCYQTVYFTKATAHGSTRGSMKAIRSYKDVLKFQITNCDKFLEYWATVPESNIVSDLSTWVIDPVKKKEPYKTITPNCGSLACAGGWLTAMDYFIELGVYPGPSGAPNMKIATAIKLGINPYSGGPSSPSLSIYPQGSMFSDEVSTVLFGSPGLFGLRWEYAGLVGRGVTDKEVVTRRFKTQKRILESVLKEINL